jgi:hypothetical protein
MKPLHLTALILPISLLTISGPLAAAPAPVCTSLATVITSKTIPNNNVAGGHVGLHVKNVGTQNGKPATNDTTVFESNGKYTFVIDKIFSLTTTNATARCPAGGASGQDRDQWVNAADLNINTVNPIKSFKCTTWIAEGHNNQGKCTATGDSTSAVQYFVKYKYFNANWVLWTVYPR